MDLKDAKAMVNLGVLGFSEFREILRDADELVPAPCGFVHVHVMIPGTGKPFTVLVSEEVFREHIHPHTTKGIPNLSLVPNHGR